MCHALFKPKGDCPFLNRVRRSGWGRDSTQEWGEEGTGDTVVDICKINEKKFT